MEKMEFDDDSLKQLRFEQLTSIFPAKKAAEFLLQNDIWNLISSYSTINVQPSTPGNSQSKLVEATTPSSTPSQPKIKSISPVYSCPQYVIYSDPELDKVAACGTMPNELMDRLVRGVIDGMVALANSEPFCRWPHNAEVKEMARSIAIRYPSVKDKDGTLTTIRRKLSKRFDNKKQGVKKSKKDLTTPPKPPSKKSTAQKRKLDINTETSKFRKDENIWNATNRIMSIANTVNDNHQDGNESDFSCADSTEVIEESIPDVTPDFNIVPFQTSMSNSTMAQNPIFMPSDLVQNSIPTNSSNISTSHNLAVDLPPKIHERFYKEIDKLQRKGNWDDAVMNCWLEKDFNLRRNWILSLNPQNRAADILVRYSCFKDHKIVIEEVRRILKNGSKEFSANCIRKLEVELESLIWFGSSKKVMQLDFPPLKTLKLYNMMKSISDIFPNKKQKKGSHPELIIKIQEHSDLKTLISKRLGAFPGIIIDESFGYIIVGGKIFASADINKLDELIVAFLGVFYVIDLDYPLHHELGLSMLQYMVFDDRTVRPEILQTFNDALCSYNQYKNKI